MPARVCRFTDAYEIAHCMVERGIGQPGAAAANHPPAQEILDGLPVCQQRFSHFPLNLYLNLERQKINKV